MLTQDGDIAIRKGDELSFSYRRSSFQDLLVLSVTLNLTKDDSEELNRRRIRKNWIMKRATQPLADQSAGCIFRNPRADAGALIEQCGLKGMSVGKARISERHANFIVTDAGADQSRCRATDRPNPESCGRKVRGGSGAGDQGLVSGVQHCSPICPQIGLA